MLFESLRLDFAANQLIATFLRIFFAPSRVHVTRCLLLFLLNHTLLSAGQVQQQAASAGSALQALHGHGEGHKATLHTLLSPRLAIKYFDTKDFSRLDLFRSHFHTLTHLLIYSLTLHLRPQGVTSVPYILLYYIKFLK